MRYDDALRYLDAHLNREATAGRIEGLTLEPVEQLLAALGDPHRAYPVIHLTGTNGKGSTANLISAALEAHGLTVGLYTSPHYERINERLCRNREPISDEELALAIDGVAVAEKISGVTPSYFEILTAAAFAWFAEVAVDIAVVEVGLLGAYDATNVVHADVAVVTNIGRDHTDGVGDWRRAVATEKAGIIEADSHLVLGDVGGDVEEIFLSRPARDRWAVGYDLTVTGDQLAVGGHLIGLHTPHGEHEDIYLSLHGTHQVENALLALGAVEAFFDRAVDSEVLQEAWGAITLPGRCEVIRRHPTVVIDGAHNPDGAAALHDALSEFPPASRRIVVFGALQDRDVGAMLVALGVQPGDLVLACEPDSERALDATDVEFVVAGMGVESEVVRDPASALERALSVAGDDDLIVVTGSIYTVGEVGRVWRDAFAASGDGPGVDDFGDD